MIFIFLNVNQIQKNDIKEKLNNYTKYNIPVNI